ncbi:MAG: LysE family transporter [Pseudomonadota bacterium]
MTLELWYLYVATVLLFMCTPGPSHLLMLSTSLANGFHRSLATAGGDLSANALQMLLAGTGLAALVTASSHGFAVVKWAGVSYLLWIGVRQLVASFRAPGAAAAARRASLRQLWFRGFVTSAANPKAVVFFAALFPQFLNPQAPLAPQLAVLGMTYLLIDGLFLTGYGVAAGWLAKRLSERRKAWLDRGSGAALVAAALLLGWRAGQRS